ncbi:MAG: ATP-binding protein [Ginsengibacter sp.]
MLSKRRFAISGENSGKEDVINFLGNSPIGIHIVNEEGTVLYANKADLDLSGFAESEFVGHPIEDFYDDPKHVDTLWEKLKKEGKFTNENARRKCKDGSVKDVLISCNAYYEAGKFQHTRCFTLDITEIKKSEDYLKLINQASQELAATHDTGEALDKIMKFLVPQFADWIVINEMSDDGFAYLLKMGHVDPEKVKMAEEYRKNHPININEPYKNSVGYALKTGETILVREVTPEIIEKGAMDEEQLMILKKLSVKSVMIIPMQIKGRITGVISFISCNPQNLFDEADLNFATDFCNRVALTLENTRLYEEVKKDIAERIEADKKKDEFISIASHELKTPVTSLKAYTQILQSTFNDEHNEAAVQMLSKMDKQIDKLTSLIVDLLDVTKIDKGELVFEMEEFDFNNLVEEVVEEMQRTTKNHKIISDLHPCDPVVGDRNRIGQVVINFISNAIKYSPEGDKIVVATFCENNKVQLSVKDDGIGIPKEEHPNIFKRFFRVSGKSNYTFPGMGLGLYISAEIIKRHSGRIFFDSEAGKGSTFSFEISSRS